MLLQPTFGLLLPARSRLEGLIATGIALLLIAAANRGQDGFVSADAQVQVTVGLSGAERPVQGGAALPAVASADHPHALLQVFHHVHLRRGIIHDFLILLEIYISLLKHRNDLSIIFEMSPRIRGITEH